jgi:hypothetical protein
VWDGPPTWKAEIVEDHTGNPLASVEVRVYKTGQRTLAAHLETDSSGRFRAPGLADGEYRIEATKANFVGATVRLQAIAGGVAHPPGALRNVITGQVVDAQGQPVLGTTVYAMPKPVNGPLMPFSAPRCRPAARGSTSTGSTACTACRRASTRWWRRMGRRPRCSDRRGGAEVRSGIGSGVQVYPTNQRPQFFAVTGGEQYRNIDFSIVPVRVAHPERQGRAAGSEDRLLAGADHGRAAGPGHGGDRDQAGWQLPL